MLYNGERPITLTAAARLLPAGFRPGRAVTGKTLLSWHRHGLTQGDTRTCFPAYWDGRTWLTYPSWVREFVLACGAATPAPARADLLRSFSILAGIGV